MRYDHCCAAFFATPWAILPEKLAEMRVFLAAKYAGEDVDPAEVARVVAGRRVELLNQINVEDPSGETIDFVRAGPMRNVQMVGRIGVVQVMGVISQRVGMLGEASGGVSAEAIGAAVQALAADKSCKAIVMQFDSPGGSVYGIAELASKIQAAKESKKVIGIADSVAASAAYWCLSQCSEVCVCPGGQVGSIGVLAAHEDQSKADELAGVKTTLISSSKYKVEGNPFEPLDDAAREEIQSKIDRYHADFTDAVAKGRNVTATRVSKDFGAGRMVMDAEAVRRGMADRISTMQQLMRRLGADDNGVANNPLYQGKLTASGAAKIARAVEVETAL
jgi:capsid assembly protease